MGDACLGGRNECVQLFRKCRGNPAMDRLNVTLPKLRSARRAGRCLERGVGEAGLSILDQLDSVVSLQPSR